MNSYLRSEPRFPSREGGSDLSKAERKNPKPPNPQNKNSNPNTREDNGKNREDGGEESPNRRHDRTRMVSPSPHSALPIATTRWFFLTPATWYIMVVIVTVLNLIYDTQPVFGSTRSPSPTEDTEQKIAFFFWQHTTTKKTQRRSFAE